MIRCNYINDYVLYGKGNLDTAAVIHDFYVYQVSEVKNMIKWIREYNETAADDEKLKFYGFDLTVQDVVWKELIQFYSVVNKEKIAGVRTLMEVTNSAWEMRSKAIKNRKKEIKVIQFFKESLDKMRTILNDVILNQGKYIHLADQEVYQRNLINIKLQVQVLESYTQRGSLEGQSRDYYMAENILYRLNHENAHTKAIIWAHNGHISKFPESNMGFHLSKVFGDKYYAFGFEFYSGTIRTRNQDNSNILENMAIRNPPNESLPWYYNRVNLDSFFLDFRNTGTEKIKNFSLPYHMHVLGYSISEHWASTRPLSLLQYDGMIYIKESTAAKEL